jgi:hypothetical protein
VLGGHDDLKVPDAAGGQEPFFLRHDKREVVRVEKPFDGELHGKKYDERVKGIEPSLRTYKEILGEFRGFTEMEGCGGR